jgi:hypothetical protein
MQLLCCLGKAEICRTGHQEKQPELSSNSQMHRDASALTME